MHEAQPPLELKAVFNKRGSDWTPREKEAVVNWIYKSHLKYLLVFSARHLGAPGTFQDAENAWQDFIVKKFEGVIKKYDPALKKDEPTQEGPFWPYLIRCFRNFCYDEGKRIRRERHREVPLIKQVETDEPIDIDIIDLFQNINAPEEPSNPLDKLEKEQEKERLQERMKQCLQQLAKEKPNYHKLLVLLYFRELPHKEIALKLGITEANLRVRLHRAHEKLGTCLES